MLQLLNSCATVAQVRDALQTVHGPYSLIFWRAESRQLLFARDPLGRRSLLSSGLPAARWAELLSALLHPNDAEVMAAGPFSVSTPLRACGGKCEFVVSSVSSVSSAFAADTQGSNDETISSVSMRQITSASESEWIELPPVGLFCLQ